MVSAILHYTRSFTMFKNMMLAPEARSVLMTESVSTGGGGNM